MTGSGRGKGNNSNYFDRRTFSDSLFRDGMQSTETLQVV